MTVVFRTRLEHLLNARFPLLYVESFEEQRVLDEITAVVGEGGPLRTPRRVVTWSATVGLVNDDGSVVPGTVGAGAALDAVLRMDEPAVVVLRDMHALLGAGRPADAGVVRRLREAAFTVKDSPVAVTLVLLSPVLAIPPDLEKDVTIVDFPLPGEEEIHSLLDSMVESNSASGRIRIDLDGTDREKLVKAAQGLTILEAENAFARAMVNDGSLSAADIDVVLEEKQQTIRKSGLLEFVPVDIALDDVGGLQNLKRWLAKREGSWLAEARAYGLPAPKGVLITGVPGCGKSLTAKAIAAAWGLPLLRLDIGRIFSGLVGSSEQNMRTGIRTAEAIAPCVLWIDEVEKGFSGSGPGGGGDSGTSSRVFGSFLTWMQEKTAPVFVIATANTIDHLPPEFLRKGRFDEIFFVDLPTRAERLQIWALQIAKRATLEHSESDLLSPAAACEALADVSEGYSGAEIEQAVIAGTFDAFAERRPVARADLERAIATMVPLSTTQAETIAAIRAWADVRAVAATAREDRSGDGAPLVPVRPTSGAAAGTSAGPAEGAGIASGARSRGGRTVDF